MEDLDFKFSNVRSEKMSDFEISIVNDLYTTLKNEVDPFLVVEYLYEKNSIDENFYREFHQNAFSNRCSRQDSFDFAASKLVQMCSLRTLIQILGKLGYQDISDKLLHRMLLPSSNVARVNRTDMTNRKRVQQYFKKLKRSVWNAEFKDPLKHLRSLAEGLKLSMTAEIDPYKKQILADRVVAVLGAEIDAHAITFDTELSDHFLFKELREIVPLTSNTMVTDVILYGRRANACAIGKHFSMGEKYLQMAKTFSAFMNPCLEIANMIYCEVYVKLWEFEQTPNVDIRESLVQMAEVGIDCLRDEEEEIRLLWTRMFLLRMIFCLLGIGNRANVIPGCSITIECLRRARSALLILDKIVDDMDTRREMFYRMAWARLYDLEGCLSEAQRSITISLRLALEGNFKEKSFIQDYMIQIITRKNESQMLYQNSSLAPSTEDLMADLMLNSNFIDLSDEDNSLQNCFAHQKDTNRVHIASLEALCCRRYDWFHNSSQPKPVFVVAVEPSVPVLDTESFCNISVPSALYQTVPIFELHRTSLSPMQSRCQNILSSFDAGVSACTHFRADCTACEFISLNCDPFPLLESDESSLLQTNAKPVLSSETERQAVLLNIGRGESPHPCEAICEHQNIDEDISAPSLNLDSLESVSSNLI